MARNTSGAVYPVNDRSFRGWIRRHRSLTVAILSSVALLVGAVVARQMLVGLNMSPGTRGVYKLDIEQGMTASQIAARLEAEGLIKSSHFFEIAARLSDFDRDIHAGTHWVDGSQSTTEILASLRKGGLNIVRVTIPEGLTVYSTAETLAESLPFTADEFDSVASSPEIVARYGLDGMETLEGLLYPDTYFLDGASNPETVIEVMTRKFHSVFTDDWRARADTIDMSPREVITLASIVEKEAMVDRERPVISQVFHKRLRIGYRLEADPTVKYVMERANRRLSLRDIEVESPYNTYCNYGLPPGPICSPGAESIRATLWPASTNYLYFVANWDGTHTFSRTLIEHNRAKEISNRRYWEMRREQRRRQQSS